MTRTVIHAMGLDTVVLHAKDSTMPIPSPRLIPILCLSAIAATATAQDAAPAPRDARAEIEVLDRGTGTPVLLRWRTDATETVTIQATTRTVPANVETPGLDDTEPDVRLAGVLRPPIEKAWTLQGRLDREGDDARITGGIQARWRVTDAAARLVGIRPATTAPGRSDQDDAKDAGDGIGAEAPPAEAPVRRERLSPKASTPDEGSDPEMMAKAVMVERLMNETLSRTDGAAITQVLGPEGVVPAAGGSRLVAPDRRADFELSTLRAIMTLAQPQLPDEPLGVGGTWRTRWRSIVRATPVVMEATWTLRSLDDAAAATGVAERAVLRVEFSRRVVDGAEVRDAQRTAIEVSGRGEVVASLTTPLRLEGRFVETPVTKTAARGDEVTRMRVRPIDIR